MVPESDETTQAGVNDPEAEQKPDGEINEAVADTAVELDSTENRLARAEIAILSLQTQNHHLTGLLADHAKKIGHLERHWK